MSATLANRESAPPFRRMGHVGLRRRGGRRLCRRRVLRCCGAAAIADKLIGLGVNDESWWQIILLVAGAIAGGVITAAGVIVGLLSVDRAR